MGDGVVELMRCIDKAFPNVGIQVNTFYHTYFCKENTVMKQFRDATGLENLVCSYAEVTDPIGKIIFGSEKDEEIEAIEKTLRSHPLAAEFDFVRSEKTLFEILPKGIGKGTAIEKLCECLGLDKKKTVAIGDYNNDISMFQKAKLGIAVSNACADAKAAADFITVSNEEHAIARVIHDIENGTYTL
ncbi:MAG: HAD-IIB family hydrolase [Clostridia bacterium]|nr:HAD-IIB family hydrolase [Clostridia bacterium]